jgi:Ca2+:H+ antiporter
MSLLLPAAFFAALDHGVPSDLVTSEHGHEAALVHNLIDDASRLKFLSISRGIAIILLVV